MEKMLVHGLNGQRLYDQARHAGIRFLRVAAPDQVVVRTNGSGAVLELSEATLPGTHLTVDCGRLILPHRIGPYPGTFQLAQLLDRQVDTAGFFQAANVRHRLVGSPRRGIFFIGDCHDETDREDIDAEIGFVIASLTAFLEDPSPDDPALISEGDCVRCLTCLRTCPHGAVVLRDGFQPVILAEACFGCGICISNCPARAIVYASKPSPLPPPRAQTVVFACTRSAALAAQAAGLPAAGAGGDTAVITIPCAGRLDQTTLVQPLLEGAARVMVVGCHEGNCRSNLGNRTAAARVRRMAAEFQGLDIDVSHHSVAANEPAKMARIIAGNDAQKEEPHV